MYASTSSSARPSAVHVDILLHCRIENLGRNSSFCNVSSKICRTWLQLRHAFRLGRRPCPSWSRLGHQSTSVQGGDGGARDGLAGESGTGKESTARVACGPIGLCFFCMFASSWARYRAASGSCVRPISEMVGLHPNAVINNKTFIFMAPESASRGAHAVASEDIS